MPKNPLTAPSANLEWPCWTSSLSTLDSVKGSWKHGFLAGLERYQLFLYNASISLERIYISNPKHQASHDIARREYVYQGVDPPL